MTETGGLEAGIALHVVNNFLALGLSLAYGDLLSTLMVSEIPWTNIVLTVTQSAVFAGLVWWVARRMGVQTRTAPPVEAPQQAVPRVVRDRVRCARGGRVARFGGDEPDVYSRPGFARSRHPWGMG